MVNEAMKQGIKVIKGKERNVSISSVRISSAIVFVISN